MSLAVVQFKTMKFGVNLTGVEKLKTQGLAIFLWEGEKHQSQEFLWLDKVLDGALSKILAEEEFEAKAEKLLIVQTHGKIISSRVFVVGLGKKSEFDLLCARKVFASLGKAVKESGVKTLGLTPSFAKETKISLVQAAQALVEGFLLGTYKFLVYNEKEKEKEKQIEEVVVAVRTASELMALKKGVEIGEVFAKATIFARDLVNEPSSVTTPTHLAGVARKMAVGGLKCRVFDRAKMRQMGMGGILGVSQGSEEPPKLIRLEYKPNEATKKIVLVGKGVTFDAGGLSLKPQEAMETMKMDMAGGAALLGIFKALLELKSKVWVIGLIPAVENMPSGKALKPGDIIKTYSGKTIEVSNTDAEGRIILADALALGLKDKPDLILDLATLTGACMVALGQDVAGIFGTDGEWIKKIQEAARNVGEKIWPMPLVNEYKELIKSEIAEIRNVSKTKYGGAITAALFLQEFVDKTPWVHLDIAGPAYAEKGSSLVPVGGSGFGVRTILEFLITKC